MSTRERRPAPTARPQYVRVGVIGVWNVPHAIHGFACLFFFFLFFFLSLCSLLLALSLSSSLLLALALSPFLCACVLAALRATSTPERRLYNEGKRCPSRAPRASPCVCVCVCMCVHVCLAPILHPLCFSFPSSQSGGVVLRSLLIQRGEPTSGNSLPPSVSPLPPPPQYTRANRAQRRAWAASLSVLRPRHGT